uniref:Uncharacterized protein n=1 Tax=Zea mays TaxID=4577 RepID=C0P356_MAIZE|nr:unknown [Zea mays]
MSEISFAKYALACGLLTLNVGVRRPLSNVNGSATRVTALANSKPLSCASFAMESISARTAAVALGSAQSCLKSSYWIPSDAAQAFNTSGSTATMATREELKLSPYIKH